MSVKPFYKRSCVCTKFKIVDNKFIHEFRYQKIFLKSFSIFLKVLYSFVFFYLVKINKRLKFSSEITNC